MLAHTKGRDRNLPPGTQIQSLRMPPPSIGSQMCHLVATLCVALSLALFALDVTDLTSGFCLRTLCYRKPMTIMGPVLNTVVVSHVVEGTLCEESRGHVNAYNDLYCILQGSIASLPRL
jgi:hypothetical protein